MDRGWLAKRAAGLQLSSMHPTEGRMAYEVSRTYPVSRERLFRALTDSTVLKKMWCVQQITVDARVGGKGTAVYVEGGQDWSFTLTYTEVRPNEELKWITRFKSFPTKETRVTVRFVDASGGAALLVRMENFKTAEERDANRQAWEQGLATLAGIV
jgi:uncharacterized protein YndB with AHSA1/START domain